MDNKSGWTLLGDLAERRRLRLGLNQDDLKRRGGPGVSTVIKIEGAKAQFPLRTRQALEKALGWDRGAVDRILDAPGERWWRDEAMREDFIATLVEENIPDLTEASEPAGSARDLTDEDLLTELTYRVRHYATRRDEDDHDHATPTRAAASAAATIEAIDAALARPREQLRLDLEAAVTASGSTPKTRVLEVRDVINRYMSEADAALASLFAQDRVEGISDAG